MVTIFELIANAAFSNITAALGRLCSSLRCGSGFTLAHHAVLTKKLYAQLCAPANKISAAQAEYVVDTPAKKLN